MCFKCGKTGHTSKDCSAKAILPEKEVAAIDEAEDQVCIILDSTTEEESFFRDIDYDISRPGINQKFRLNTLMDTGGSVRHVK